jgi:exonuclease SbcD
MNFTFLHAADLHLGSPLTGLAQKDEVLARRFALASREAFSELVARAISESVGFVLIAGDIYDGDWKDTSIGLFFNREVARLTRAGIPVFLIRGNHDAESEITRAVPLPDGVIEFSARKAETKRIAELKVAIHGQSFADRAATENIAISYPMPVSGWLNVGLLHTSCEGHTAHAVYAPCSVQDLVARGYDYWALGHVHEHAVLNRDPWIVYPGNLQGRSVRECGPKGAVLVDVADGRIAGVRPLALDRARWLHQTVDVTGLETINGLVEMVREAIRAPLEGTGGQLAALRVTLNGVTPLHSALKARQTDLRDEVQAIVNHWHDDAWLESVRIATTEAPVEHAAGRDGTGIDPAALLAGLETDPGIRLESARLIGLLKSKLPGALTEGVLDDLDGIIADARALVSARTLSEKA